MRVFIYWIVICSGLAVGQAAWARPVLAVAYAGSMGVVMDKYLGPTFCKTHDCTYEGDGQGAYGLAHLIESHALTTDVFVSITPGPMRILRKAGIVTLAVPVASTQMVIAYSPLSRYAALFRQAAMGKIAWYAVLEKTGVKFGRTDPRTDPQGQNIVFTFQLAQQYYHKRNLVARILGPINNPRQIFTEPSLLARLDAGELDASSGYLSAVRSLHLPFIRLPAQINLSDPTWTQKWYDHAHFSLIVHGRAKVVFPQPLVFYAAVPVDAPHPKLGAAFIRFLVSHDGQRIFHKTGYDKPLGGVLK